MPEEILPDILTGQPVPENLNKESAITGCFKN